MTALEICFIIAGMVMFIGSFFVIEKFSTKELQKMSQLGSDEIGKIMDKELENTKVKVEEALDEVLEIVQEKAEREFEKISNEKIMAVNEYSETVLEEINKNHKEVVFLYSMLCDKQQELKEMVESYQASMKKVKVSQMKTQEQVPEQVKPPQIQSPLEPKSPKPSLTQEFQEESQIFDKEDYINNNQRILELYQQGKMPVEIARELSLGIGEVKLVIDLFKGDK